VIKSFRDKGTEDLFDGRDTKQARKSCPSDLVRVVRRKLDQLNQAEVLGDLRAPPSNRLEKLKGEREGQYLDPDQRSVAGVLPVDRVGR
jgi:proteic killer suppression protein